MREEAALDEPLLVVLCDAEKGRWRLSMRPSSVYLIDVDKGIVSHKIPTRSPAYDLAVGYDGRIYTAQGGGWVWMPTQY